MTLFVPDFIKMDSLVQKWKGIHTFSDRRVMASAYVLKKESFLLIKNWLMNSWNCSRLNLLISTHLIWWMVDLQLFWVSFGPLSCTSRYELQNESVRICMGLLINVVCSLN